MVKTVITIEGHTYDVTLYAGRHPGEGFRQTYLVDCKGKDMSEEFFYNHLTDEPWEILEKVREKGEYMGIKFLPEKINNTNKEISCPNY